MTTEAEAIRKYRESDEAFDGGVSVLNGMRSELAEMIKSVNDQEKYVQRLGRDRAIRHHELQVVILGKAPQDMFVLGLS